MLLSRESRIAWSNFRYYNKQMGRLLQNRSHADDTDLENRIYLLEKDLEQKPDLAKYIVPTAFKTAKNRYKQFVQQEDLELPLTKIITQLLQNLQKKPLHVHLCIYFENESSYPIVMGVQKDFDAKKQFIRAYFPILFCSLDAVSHIALRDKQLTFIISSQNLEDYVWDLLLLDKQMLIKFDKDLMKPQEFIALGLQGILSNDIFSFPINSEKA